MADTTFAEPPEDNPPEPEGEHCLGKFRRHPAEFSVIFVSTPLGTPNVYRVDCDDGVGPHEVCRFGDDPAEPVIWRGAWQGDPWCAWILKNARELVAKPSLFDF
ncbi:MULTISPECIES: hypothetical protein [Glycomyces]|uniref:Uncharacterized protein n=2 Tax=Glycomyces TaxID=58113 RepID=A0A9X3SXC7_9ACTN|nr:hypothetical protein [Glycomyces lechevalierae]MDA1388244.1 hypothetical protein [Glycomyces lechevalierae]MDR7337313.1 hypothetical protein [Glycomyces lechevalierae]